MTITELGMRYYLRLHVFLYIYAEKGSKPCLPSKGSALLTFNRNVD